MAKEFIVDIEFDPIEIRVSAKNKTEAKKKALARLKRRKPASLIRTYFFNGRKVIDVNEI